MTLEEDLDFPATTTRCFSMSMCGVQWSPFKEHPSLRGEDKVSRQDNTEDTEVQEAGQREMVIVFHRLVILHMTNEV